MRKAVKGVTFGRTARGKDEEADMVAVDPPPRPSLAQQVLQVTVHRGVDLPAMDSTGFSDPYCTLQMSGSRSAPEETKCVKQTLNPVWEDTFELDVLAPSQQLLVDVYDRDWMLGIPLKPDYMGRITVPLSSVPDGPVGITQWYAILDADTNTPLHGKVQLTLRKKQLEEMESKASFWSLFKGDKNSESSSAALENDIDKEMGAVKAIFVHLRPILNNIFRLLYVVVRPIMMLLLAQRHVLMDWEKPGLTAVYCVVYFWSWYHDMQFAVFFTFMLFHVAYWVWQGQVPVRSTMLKTSEQLEAYKAVKAELKYGRVDPLVKDLRLVELATRTVADRVEQFMDDLVVKRKHRVVAITLGSLLAVSFVCAYFARKVDNLIFYAAKTLSLTLFVRVTFILPFSWRYPQVLPHLLAVVLDPIKKFSRPFRRFLRLRRQQRGLVKAEQWDSGTLNSTTNNPSHHFTAADWTTVVRQLGEKIVLRKHAKLEEPRTLSHNVYWLAKGKVEMRSPTSARAFILLNSPCVLFAANVLSGHGRIMRTMAAYTKCVLYRVNVTDFRHYLDVHPELAERYWRDQAAVLALEVRLQSEKLMSKKALRVSIVGGVELQSPSAPSATPQPPASGAHAQSLHQRSRTLNAFSMAEQMVKVDSKEQDSAAELYKQYFGLEVDRREIKQYRNVWTKRNFTKYPGRLFVTPEHISFWAQVGKKGALGSVSRGVTVESWQIPFVALHAFSLHDRDGHIKFTVDNNLLEAAAIAHPLAGPATGERRLSLKTSTHKIFSADTKQLAEIAKIVLEIQEQVSPLAHVEAGAHEAQASLQEMGVALGGADVVGSQVKGPLSKTQMLARGGIVPLLHGVELSLGEVNDEKDTAWEMPNELFTFVHGFEKVKEFIKENVRGTRSDANGAHNVEKECSLATIMYRRAQVLTDDDKVHLQGMTEDEGDDTLLEFSKGAVILEEGAHYEARSIFQLTKGECHITKGDHAIAVLPAGSILGEMSFLIDDPITANVIAGSKHVQLRQLTEAHLEAKFRKYPGLGGRFYEFLCYVLVNRLHRLFVKISSLDAATIAEVVDEAQSENVFTLRDEAAPDAADADDDDDEEPSA